MNCRDIQQLITLHLDGALGGEQETALREHLAVCPSCARELALQERLSRALRDLSSAEVEAPPELCGLVMGKLREDRRKAIHWLPPAWRKSIAAAAAFLIIAGGSVGLGAGLKLTGNGWTVGRATTSTGTVQNPGGIVTEQAPPDNGGSHRIEPAQESAPVAGQGGESSSGAQGGNPGPAATGNVREGASNTGAGAKATGPGVSVASGQDNLVLLSSSMKVSSTLLKISVTDLTEAKIRATALAAGAGAAALVFPEQNDGRRIQVMRLTAASDQAAGLTAGLTGLGTVIDRQDESRDLTHLYNETLIQYRDLQSRIKASHEAEERQRLEVQAATCKQQLDAWEAEAGKKVIILWLESRQL